ncbi:MAG: HIRAN domain-containing protein [Gammaproteobacteria bacterium]|nr:HIRAN domain-containing protein [Gammaproteobacteria bacterium]
MPESYRFGRMRDLYKVYQSEELFPMLSSRVLAKNRPEYKKYLEWLGLSEARYDVLDELARTGGLRATDSLELFPCPEPTAGQRYEVYFFCRGLRHLHEENQKRARQMESGERLYLMQDLQNTHDKKALLLRTKNPVSIVGYAPRYYSAEFTQLISSTDPDQVRVTVERVNRDAPVQYQILCKLVSPWPANFLPCADKEFEALAVG